ncbi:rho family-interacting cell polarization regulator 2 isoform X4 [Marmota marmota marmota]|uniref:rho family-interacting cell polarization regulator 2 isoform X4 n=1 Tax=Marmota marmota marmota TaxID=9994 RepID=UPI002092EF56|nr:rho family-interacting cell polarization regulator 2 isoform X4 [Marmota marmota marmota]
MVLPSRLHWIRSRPWRDRIRRRQLNRLPTRLPEIMLVGSQSFSPGGPNGIIRSQSFAGFSGLQERRSRCNSFIENSSALKKPQTKLKKMHNLGHKNNNPPKEPQPTRVEEVYRALKKGLSEYLDVHQTELDKLTTQLRDMKRNSRLGVLYDLDKQIKTIERYMRRLEFHISKVDELYEAYCIQRRLQDGASKMKQAFAVSPASRAARESLSEISRSYKEYTENMCALEAELENLLGEFSIKMKGLAGFARLCPGDQYEVFMKCGRQRWKLKGKIEVNGKQSWDGEETVFLPLIVGFISIKVTELKGLATHLLVGSVTCETKELFAARPQVVAVDINDLGTIKLNLEITWYPFDVEDTTPSSGGAGNKTAALQRRMSMYSQGTPETPTFKDHSFFANLPDDIFETGKTAEEQRPLSLSNCDLPNGDCALPCSPAASPSSSGSANPEITITPAELSHTGRPSQDQGGDDGSWASSRNSSGEGQEPKSPLQEDPAEPRKPSAATALGAERLFLENAVAEALLQESDEASELKPVELDTCEGNVTKQLVKRLTSAEVPAATERLLSEDSASGESFLDGSLEDALSGLFLALEPHKEEYKEFQDLNQEVMHLDDILKQVVFSSKTPFVARNLLEKLSRQTQVMERLSAVSDEEAGSLSSVVQALPEFHKKLSLLSFWTKCCGPAGVYHSSADRVIKQLEASFARTVNKEYPGLADPVFRTLVSQILDRTEPLLSSSLSSEVVTVFQYCSYFTSHGVSDLESHLCQLARQVSMVHTLQSLRDEKLLQAVGNLAPSSLLAQQEVLRTLALLLTRDDSDISQAVTLYLAAASKNEHFREKALLYYCEALTKTNLQLQKAACLALRSLGATESIKMLVTLCQSDTEEIRNVASETLLSLGEDGRLAYEQLDKFPRDGVKVGGRHGAEVATAF